MSLDVSRLLRCLWIQTAQEANLTLSEPTECHSRQLDLSDRQLRFRAVRSTERCGGPLRTRHCEVQPASCPAEVSSCLLRKCLGVSGGRCQQPAERARLGGGEAVPRSRGKTQHFLCPCQITALRPSTLARIGRAWKEDDRDLCGTSQ